MAADTGLYGGVRERDETSLSHRLALERLEDLDAEDDGKSRRQHRLDAVESLRDRYSLELCVQQGVQHGLLRRWQHELGDVIRPILFGAGVKRSYGAAHVSECDSAVQLRRLVLNENTAFVVECQSAGMEVWEPLFAVHEAEGVRHGVRATTSQRSLVERFGHVRLVAVIDLRGQIEDLIRDLWLGLTRRRKLQFVAPTVGLMRFRFQLKSVVFVFVDRSHFKQWVSKPQ